MHFFQNLHKWFITSLVFQIFLFFSNIQKFNQNTRLSFHGKSKHFFFQPIYYSEYERQDQIFDPLLLRNNSRKNDYRSHNKVCQALELYSVKSCIIEVPGVTGETSARTETSASILIIYVYMVIKMYSISPMSYNACYIASRPAL